MAAERQVAIVTGAASGIGRAMTLGLLEGAIDVAAVDKETAWLDELKAAAGVKGLSGALQTIRADLADPASFETIVSTVLDASGRIDILVNNAGIGQGSIRADQRRNPLRFWEITPEQWSGFLAVNATAPLMMKLFQSFLLKSTRFQKSTTLASVSVRGKATGPCAA